MSDLRLGSQYGSRLRIESLDNDRSNYVASIRVVDFVEGQMSPSATYYMDEDERKQALDALAGEKYDIVPAED